MTHNYVAACGINVDRLREALEKNSALHTLSLRRCCIGGWRRARAIARGLALNRGLTSVDLSYNGLGAASQQAAPPQPAALSLAVEALCQALRSNRQLRALGLAHNCLGDGGGVAVLHAVLEGTPGRRSNPARRRAGLGMAATPANGSHDTTAAARRRCSLPMPTPSALMSAQAAPSPRSTSPPTASASRRSSPSPPRSARAARAGYPRRRPRCPRAASRRRCAAAARARRCCATLRKMSATRAAWSSTCASTSPSSGSL